MPTAKDEVTERWGAETYERGDRWWGALTAAQKQRFQQDQLDIAADYGRARQAVPAPDSAEVQMITRRHYEWVTVGWQGRRPGAQEFAGLGEMYVADERFGVHYDRHGKGTAELVRDAMKYYADTDLE